MRAFLEDEEIAEVAHEDWRWLNWLADLSRYYYLGASVSQMGQRKWWDILTMSLAIEHRSADDRAATARQNLAGHNSPTLGDWKPEWPRH